MLIQTLTNQARPSYEGFMTLVQETEKTKRLFGSFRSRFFKDRKIRMPAIFLVGLFCTLFSYGVDVVASSHQEFQDIQSHIFEVAETQPYRTSYHFQPPNNWINDPNGPMWYKGFYHLFYQYNPYAAVFGDTKVWAHSVSHDLINWIHLNYALCPTEPFDINSVWSGSVTFIQGNKPVILYTGIDANNTQVQNLAMPKNLSDPLLKEWVKYSQNPVMTPPDGVKADNFRDPSTAWLGPDGKWNVVVGSLRNDQGGAFLYKSKDFFHWNMYKHPLYSTERFGMWENPDFFPVSINSKNGVDTSVLNPSVRHVMKASFHSHDYYMIGTYVPEMEKYIPDNDLTGTFRDLRFDYGKLYASKTFYDHVKNRRISWAWVNESDSIEDDINKGWSGLQSIPRQIWLDRSGKQLVHWPVEEINKLHDKKVSIQQDQHQKLSAGLVVEIQGITAGQADVEIEFEWPELDEAELLNSTQADPQIMCSDANASVKGRLGPFGLIALATKDLTELTAIFFRIFEHNNGYVVLMCSDQSRSSLREGVDKTTYGAFVNIDPQHDKISLRSLIDHSIIESFGGKGRVCITSRVYPKFAVHEKAHLYVFNNGTQSVTISKLNAWGMINAEISNEESIY